MQNHITSPFLKNLLLLHVSYFLILSCICCCTYLTETELPGPKEENKISSDVRFVYLYK